MAEVRVDERLVGPVGVERGETVDDVLLDPGSDAAREYPVLLQHPAVMGEEERFKQSAFSL